MNLLGRRSLSSFFKVLLDVAFYVACLASALLVVAAVVASRADNSNVGVSLRRASRSIRRRIGYKGRAARRWTSVMEQGWPQVRPDKWTLKDVLGAYR